MKQYKLSQVPTDKIVRFDENQLVNLLAALQQSGAQEIGIALECVTPEPEMVEEPKTNVVDKPIDIKAELRNINKTKFREFIKSWKNTSSRRKTIFAEQKMTTKARISSLIYSEKKRRNI